MQRIFPSFKPLSQFAGSRCFFTLRSSWRAVRASAALVSALGLLFGLARPAPGQLPPGWTDEDIGFPSASGSAIYSGGFWSVYGGGADIGGFSDQFNFAYELTTDDVIIARIDSIENTDGWAKAGVMFRDSVDPYSVCADIVISSANGLSFQWRNSYAGQSASATIGGLFAPIWVKLVRANNQFSAYYGSDGVAWTPIGSPQTILMSTPQLAGLCVTAHNDTALNTSTFEGVTSSYVPPAPPPPPPTFGVYRELWSGICCSLDALTNTALNPNWPSLPDPGFTTVYTNFEADANTGMNDYGQRMRAFVMPGTNGNYTFWISSDDNSELFLSTDETEANKIPIAAVPGWTNPREWGKYPNQQSAPVFLEGGRRYYLEAIMQQGGGGDNLAVRWQSPDYTFEEPLPALSPKGTRLIPCTGVDQMPGIYQQTTNISVIEGVNVLMSVLVTNQSAVAYQWRLNGVSLGTNAQKPFFSITNVTIAANNGQIYACSVSNSVGAITSAPIRLTVVRDLVPPAVLRTINVGTATVQVVYSKIVEAASATNTANYHFTNGLAITRASLGADNMTVTLATAPLVYGSNYTILVSNVRDRASTPNTIAANTPANFTALPYTPQDIGNLSPPSLTTFVSNGVNVVAYGTDIGGGLDQFSLNYQPRTGDFDIGLRVMGLSPSDVWAKAGLMARETLDPGSRFAAALTTPTMVGSFFEWRDPAFSQANMAGRFPINYPNAWLRLKRAGNTFTGFASYDGQTWIQLGTAVISMPAQVYVGPVASSHNAGLATTVQFRDIADLINPVTGTIVNPSEPLGPCSRLTPIVISEIMYKPAPRTDGNNLEFVEVYNSNPYPEDISGFQLLGNNMNYVFPPGTIMKGGAFLVVAASPASMANVYGLGNVLGPYSGSLKATDVLQLLDEQGVILLSVPYMDVSPWPVGPDGTGHSLVLARPTYGEGDPRAWDISDVVGGSPGASEAFRPSPLRNVVINEFLAHTDPPAFDYVELYNHANQPVDVSGCTLSDQPNTNKFVIPPGTVIPARGFVWFSETTMNFRLSSLGDQIFFKNPDGSRVLDAVQFDGQENGVATGRWPDGAIDFYRLTAQTPGTNNASIRLSDVVINELMYNPISGNDDDQYVELYNRSTNTVNLGMWQLQDAVSFTFPSNTLLNPDNYLVIARNAQNLRGNYTNLTTANCLGDFGGRLGHKGEHLALAMPHYDLVTNGTQITTAITAYIAVNEVTYSRGGRWGQWAAGGGSSLELKDPNSNNRLAYNWGDSDETMKSVWTNLEFTGTLDNGGNYNSGLVDFVEVGLQDVGECLVDNVEIHPDDPAAANIVSNGDFESGMAGWTVEGDHMRSSLETTLRGYNSPTSLHLRSSDGVWTMPDYARGTLTQTTLGDGSTATLRLKARWLRGWPELLMRVRGNWIEVTGRLPVPANLGTPGLRNSRYTANAGPAIYEVKHSPPLPGANQPVVVTARFHDFKGVQPTLLYRVDLDTNPAPAYISVPMVDNRTAGDAVAGDGLYSATIPGQAAGTVVAFLVQASDTLGATTLFPADLHDNAGIPRECVVGFGDPIPTGSFSHHHVFMTHNWANRWAQGGGVSHELNDGTWIDGGGRIVYDWVGRYAGSPYHQYLGSPVTTIGGMHWIVPWDDQIFGTASLNKQHVPGNGALDDNTLQREQISYWMAHQIGLQRQHRRYYFYYVNGNRHGPLMEDTQVPGAEMLKEYWPNDNNGWLYKNHAWFECDVAQGPDGYINFNNMSWCNLDPYTTSVDGVQQYKTARYRWMWWVRQYPDSANNFSNVFALIDAANTPTTSPDYYANMEAQVDTEEWLRWSALEHATGDWDSFFTQNAWNMYTYKPTRGKWTALKWDWNITLGSGTQTWPSDGSQLFNAGTYDPIMASFHTFPAYRRAYLRALLDVANLAMNNALVNPVLDARYAAFVGNGLTTTSAYGLQVQEPGAAGLKNWIGTMHNSILAALTNQGAMNVRFAITSTVVSNNVAIVSGTAPLPVKLIWFNGIPYPITWTSITAWTAIVPLQPGSNPFNVVGVDLHNQPVPGSSAVISPTYTGGLPSPVGQVVLNEVMYHSILPGAEYLELYNNSTTVTFDLSGWQLRGLDYTFPAGSLLAPNDYLLLSANRSAFSELYGGTLPMFDTFTGTLPADGQPLLLVKPGANSSSDLLVAGVQFGSGAPWPAGANTAGISLQLVDLRQDNWRVANWQAATTNATAPPQWVYVTATGPASSSTLLIYLQSAGDIYLDDLKLVSGSVAGVGPNLLADGDFESGFPGPWAVSANLAASSLSGGVRHGGTASLHLVSSAPGTSQSTAIWQTVSPGLILNQTYTLSFWYLQSPNGGPLTIRLNGSGLAANVIPAPPAVLLAPATPGAANSVATTLPAFPPLWLNELQADNLTGITNSAGQRTAWAELYNPTTGTVSLDGLYLANNYSNVTQWPFPRGAVINPGQFKIVFADGQTNLSTLNELHTSFVLPSGTGTLVLTRQTTNAQVQVLDYLPYTNLPPNRSYGSFPDGQSFFRQQFFLASPGGTNNASVPFSYIAYTSPGQVYNQNFDALPNPGLISVNAANPVAINGVIYSLANPFDFALPISPSGNTGGLGLPSLSGWYGQGALASKFGATDGDQTTGGVLSFGLPNSGNRALGLLATSSTGGTAFGAKFINQTTSTFNSINLQVTGEVWRQSNLPKTLRFFYYIDPTATAPFPVTATGFVPSLDVNIPTLPSAVGGVAVDGTSSVNQTNLGVTSQVITNWPPGAALWLVWQMVDNTGRAQGLGIDNLSFSASVQVPLIPVPVTVQTSSTNLVMSWPSYVGQMYQVEYKDDLSASTWTALGAPLAGTGAPLAVTNNFNLSAHRFFRLVILP